MKEALEPFDCTEKRDEKKKHKKQTLVLIDESLRELELTLWDSFTSQSRFKVVVDSVDSSESVDPLSEYLNLVGADLSQFVCEDLDQAFRSSF